MLGQVIQQTPVHEVLVEERLDIAAEWYAAVLIDGEQFSGDLTSSGSVRKAVEAA